MLSDERKLTISQAARIVPGRPHVSSVWRWCRKGVKTRSGQRVRLEHCRYGSRIFTSKQALDRFAHRLAEADVENFAGSSDHRPDASRKPRSHQKRQRDIDRADAELREANI